MTNMPQNLEQQCPLCGFWFNPEEAKSACSRCPLNKNCNVYCCPNCQYQFLKEYGILNVFKKIKKWWRDTYEHP